MYKWNWTTSDQALHADSYNMFCDADLVMEIKQEFNDNDGRDEPDLVKLDDLYSYPHYDNGFNRIKSEGVNISKCDKYGSTTPTSEYVEDNKATVKDENKKIENEGASGRYHLEHSIENVKPIKLAAHIKRHIKVEDMLAVDVKVDEQDSESDIKGTKLEELTEGFDTKPDGDMIENVNSDLDLDRAVKKEITEKEQAVLHKEADIGSFICYHCNFTAYSKKDLIYHISVSNCSSKSCGRKTLIVDKELGMTCEYVGQFIGSEPSKIYTCTNCNYKTTIETNLAKHMLIHSVNYKLITCTYCSATFKNKTNLDDHVIRNHKEFIESVSSKIHQCEHCSYKTTMSSHLARHLLKHLDTEFSYKLSKCVHCDSTFRRKMSLDDHVIKKHPNFIGTVSSKIHECTHCNYKSTNKTALAKHIRKHLETKTTYKHSLAEEMFFICKCPYCDARFKRKTILDDHIVKKHEEYIASVSSKIHECKHCSYKTTMSTHFNKHMFKHPETGCSYKPSTCIHCNATFKSKPALDDHVIKKHTEFIASVSSKIHQCKHCSYKTTISTEFTRHMTNHPEGTKLNTCIHCNVTYKTKRALDSHMYTIKCKPCIATVKN